MAFAGLHQECRATFPALAEMEIEAGDDGAGMKPVDQDGLNEFLRRALRKFPVEGIFDDGAETDGLKDARLQRRGREAKHRRVGTEDGTGMRLEGQHQRGNATGFRQFQSTIQHSPVAAMHAVEIADGDDAATKSFRQRLLFFIAVKDGHGNRSIPAPAIPQARYPQARRGIHQPGAAPCPLR
ncbi:hypothetical protein D3C86_1437900 [compost metagenome]